MGVCYIVLYKIYFATQFGNIGIYRNSFSFEMSGDKLVQVLSQPEEFQWTIVGYQLILLNISTIHYFYNYVFSSILIS